MRFKSRFDTQSSRDFGFLTKFGYEVLWAISSSFLIERIPRGSASGV